MWSFGADQDPHPFRPAGQIQDAGGLDDPGAVPDFPVRVVRLGPGDLQDFCDVRDVVLGQRDGQSVEIVTGLTAGETIAVSNTFSLKAELSKPGEED